MATKLVNLKSGSDILIPKVSVGIDTSNVLASVGYVGGSSTYTATEDCYFYYTSYNNNMKLNDTTLFTAPSGDNQYQGYGLMKKGDVFSKSGPGSYKIFGLKY